MAHMPPTGVSGWDLYARDASGQWRWVMVSAHGAGNANGNRAGFDSGPAGIRPLDLPLYNGVESFSIGVPGGAQFEGLPARPKPLIFYGTSTTQRPVRLSGHGVRRHPGPPTGPARRQPRFLRQWPNGCRAIGDLLVEIDASAYIIDCVGNMSVGDITGKCIALVKQLRAARPATPIFLLEGDHSPNSLIQPFTPETER